MLKSPITGAELENFHRVWLKIKIYNCGEWNLNSRPLTKLVSFIEGG